MYSNVDGARTAAVEKIALSLESLYLVPERYMNKLRVVGCGKFGRLEVTYWGGHRFVPE